MQTVLTTRSGTQSEILGLKSRFGHSIAPAKRAGAKANDMSHAGLQILTLELENLHAERAQRERKLDMLLGRLRKACIELDEDDNAAAAAAHPSLQNHRCWLNVFSSQLFASVPVHTVVSCAVVLCILAAKPQVQSCWTSRCIEFCFCNLRTMGTDLLDMLESVVLCFCACWSSQSPLPLYYHALHCLDWCTVLGTTH